MCDGCVSNRFTVLYNKKRTKQASLLASVTMPSTKTHIWFIWFQVSLWARLRSGPLKCALQAIWNSTLGEKKLLFVLITAATTNKPASCPCARWNANQKDLTGWCFLTFCPQHPSELALTLSGPKGWKNFRIPPESSKCRSRRPESSLCRLICGSSSSWGGAASTLVQSERRWAGGLAEGVSQRKRMEGIYLPPPFHLPPRPSDHQLRTNALQRSKTLHI